ncbi:hypothetical protein OUZ56_032558 [Daphnia magna]|uniref:Glycosyl transferase family 1 domain-containing protein n=1 Tax=Daphnia magna TaxID=35525 RepID=A0ABR0B9M3_9CRUS|nr:hypothetical protein OUZ56_032558 [Daphnia magna]
MQLRARILVPGDPGQMTGGYLYDAWVAAGLSARGHDVAVLDLHAPETDEALAVFGTVVVVDELAHREYLARTRRKPREFLALVHHLSSWEPAERHPRSWLVGAREEAFPARVGGPHHERPERRAPLSLRADGPPAGRRRRGGPERPRGFSCTMHVCVGRDDHRAQAAPAARTCRPRGARARRSLSHYWGGSLRTGLCKGELLAHVAEAEALFLVSSFEGYGMAAAEALALGTPIVVTAIVAEALGAAVRPGENALVIDGVDGLRDAFSELRRRPLVFSRPPALLRRTLCLTAGNGSFSALPERSARGPDQRGHRRRREGPMWSNLLETAPRETCARRLLQTARTPSLGPVVGARSPRAAQGA